MKRLLIACALADTEAAFVKIEAATKSTVEKMRGFGIEVRAEIEDAVD